MKTYSVGGIAMSSRIMLGAGVCKYVPQLVPFNRPDIPIGATVFGSLTPEPRIGNTEQPLFWPVDWDSLTQCRFGLNSFGMNNDGIDASLKALNSIELVHPCIASLAAFSVDDYMALLQEVETCKRVSGSEVNLGCGNVGHLPHAYNSDFITRLLGQVEAARFEGRLTKPIWLKLSPYLTRKELDIIATSHPEIDFSQTPTVEPWFFGWLLRTIIDFGCVNALVFSNTLANCRYFGPDGRPVTGPFEGRAGLSGPILHAISMNLISQARGLVWNAINPPSLIHVGGNLTGDDVCTSLYGADAVQCTSGPFWSGDGPRFFADLIAESEKLQEYLLQEYLLAED